MSFKDGKMYVFDERITVDVNHVNPTIVRKTGLMEHHVNVMSAVKSIHQANQYLDIQKMKTSTFVDAHTSAVFTT